MSYDSGSSLHRLDETAVRRLFNCFVQGNRIASAAAKLQMSETEVTVWYMRFSLGEAVSELRRFGRS